MIRPDSLNITSDKKLFEYVVFLLIQGFSYTVVAVPQGTKLAWTSDRAFSIWRGSLKLAERRKVDQFIENFKEDAFREMKTRWAEDWKKSTRVDVHYFSMQPGCLLVFQADRLYHASIVPSTSKDTPRTLLVFHPLKCGM